MNLGDPMRRAWLSPSTKVVVSFRESEMSIVVLIRETLQLTSSEGTLL